MSESEIVEVPRPVDEMIKDMNALMFEMDDMLTKTDERIGKVSELIEKVAEPRDLKFTPKEGTAWSDIVERMQEIDKESAEARVIAFDDAVEQAELVVPEAMIHMAAGVEHVDPEICETGMNRVESEPFQVCERKRINNKKKELHKVLNCLLTKEDSKNSNICVSERFKDPRFHNVHDYAHSIRYDIVCLKDLRMAIGKINDPITDDCRNRFMKFRGYLTKISNRISDILDSTEDT